MDIESDIDPGSQPHPQTGTSTSQPLEGETRRLLTKYRRYVTGPTHTGAYHDFGVVPYTNEAPVAMLPERPFETIEQFRTAVFNVLCKRLQARGHVSHLLRERDFKWCLPKSYVCISSAILKLPSSSSNMYSINDVNVWRLLLHDPLFVSQDMLSEIITTEPSIPDSPDTESGATLFYIRTFRLTVREFGMFC